MKRPWLWERLKAGGEGDNRGWDGWMPSLTWWTWVWARSGSWWWTGRPGMLRFMGSQRVGRDWATELNWTDVEVGSFCAHFWKSFNHKWVLNFVKGFFCIYWDDHMVFIFSICTVDWPGEQRKPKTISPRTKLTKAQTGKQNWSKVPTGE